MWGVGGGSCGVGGEEERKRKRSGRKKGRRKETSKRRGAEGMDGRAPESGEARRGEKARASD